MSLSTVIRALEPRGLRKTGAQSWIARCPSHDDQKASLTVGQGEQGKALLKCQAGCDIENIVSALGLTLGDLFPDKHPSASASKIVAQYDYRDEMGTLLYQVVRFDPKDFRQRRPDGPTGWTWKLGDVRRVLYRLRNLVDPFPPDTRDVYVVEGEKDADRLSDLMLVATTNVGGAGKWRPEYSGFLRDRNVVILPDNDDPGRAHAEQVAKALAGVAASVKIVCLPDLPDKGDVSDWLKAGGTAEDLAALVRKTSPESVTPFFRSSPDRLPGERQERLEIGTQTLSFGVNYLDHALGGITPRDLVIFGAKTGIGKTALATITALHNAQRGKRVHYFVLEGEEREIERRMKFQLIAAEYYRSGFHRPVIRYLDWYMGRLDQELGYYEDSAEEKLRTVLSSLFTFYRHDTFTSEDFCRELETIRDQTDLVILDHLHYVDSDDENENRGYKRTVKQIRDSALKAGKPVIVVAHVRKGDRRAEPLVPTIEDFHGSSDIPKIATKAVMLAAAYDIPNPQPFLWNTYMQVAKCRLDSSLTRYVAVVQYDTRINGYAENYTLGRLADGGKAFAHLATEEMPIWASPPT
jgi:hypothetical protein